MKKQILSFALAVILACSAFSLSACGGSNSKQVPDSVLEREELSELLNRVPDEASLSWHAEHRVDDSAHTDDVDLILTIKGTYGEITYTKSVTYLYDKSSDLWARYQDGSWRTSTTLYDNLIGTYAYNNQSNSNTITITQVNGDRIDFSYQFIYFGEIRTEYYKWIPPEEMTLSGSATATVGINAGIIDGDFNAHSDYVPLPEGFYIIDTLKGAQTSVDLYIGGNIFEGISTFGGGYLNLFWKGDY